MQSNPPTPENPGFEGALRDVSFLSCFSVGTKPCVEMTSKGTGMRETHLPAAPSGSQQTPLNWLLILTSETSPQRLPTPAPPAASPALSFLHRALHRRLIIFLAQKPLLTLPWCSASWGRRWEFQPSRLCVGGLKILRNGSSLSYPGWALIERQSLPRIRRDCYFPRMASSINSSLPGSEVPAGRACACMIPGQTESCRGCWEPEVGLDLGLGESNRE